LETLSVWGWSLAWLEAELHAADLHLPWAARRGVQGLLVGEARSEHPSPLAPTLSVVPALFRDEDICRLQISLPEGAINQRFADWEKQPLPFAHSLSSSFAETV